MSDQSPDQSEPASVPARPAPPYDPLRFGAVIKRRRLARGLTQLQLGEEAGYSHGRISQLENGRVIIGMTWPFLLLMAHVLRMPVEQLMEEGGVERAALGAPDFTRLSEQRQLLLADLNGLDEADVADVRQAVRALRNAIVRGRREPGEEGSRGPDEHDAASTG